MHEHFEEHGSSKCTGNRQVRSSLIHVQGAVTTKKGGAAACEPHDMCAKLPRDITTSECKGVG